VVEVVGVAVLWLVVGLGVGEGHVVAGRVDVGEGDAVAGGVVGAEAEGVGVGVPPVGALVEGHPAGELGEADGVGVAVGDGLPPVLALGSAVGGADGRAVLAEALGGGGVVREGVADGVAGPAVVAGAVVGAAVVADGTAGVAD
jgi:hypothetical protein